MADNNTTTVTTWVIIIIIAIIIIAGIWWYFAQQSTPAPTGGTTTQTQTQTLSSDKSIVSFTLSGLTPAVTGTIDEANHTITLQVPKNTNVTNLAPTITVSNGATVAPASGAPQDFTHPVTYTVSAQDGTTQNYVVTVTKAAQ